MKRKLSISFIAVSAIFLLTLMALPHHYHYGQACFVMEVCDQDRNVDDKPLPRHTDVPDDGYAGTCIAETEFITPSLKGEAKYKTTFFNDDYPDPNCLPVADLLNSETGNFVFKTAYGEHISFYKSAEVVRCNGLRAPPFMLS